MSTLERATSLLQNLSEEKLKTICSFIEYIKDDEKSMSKDIVNDHSAFGIAHKYANPELMEREKEAFIDAMAQKHAFG